MLKLEQHGIKYGNPQLNCYHDHIIILTENTNITSSSIAVHQSDEERKTIERIKNNGLVCLLHVPSHQIPEGILSLSMKNYNSYIRHVRIVLDSCTYRNDDAKLQLGGDDSDEDDEYFYAVLIQFADPTAARDFILNTNHQPYSSFDTSEIYEVFHCEMQVSKVMDPFLKSSNKDDEITTSSSVKKNHDQSCAVCLEHINYTERSSSSKISTSEKYTNHTVALHKRNASNTAIRGGASTTSRSSQGIITTICNHTFHIECLLQWKDSPCPVCRYDHSAVHKSLSRCHTCDSTSNTFICLICGVVSCSTGSSTSEPTHAQRHYQETLHTYALDTETQHVWDFAGEGYVHRLLQNKDDGKLVEIQDPRVSESFERTLNPEMSDIQEGEVVHRKLEGFADEYHKLLKRQLEEQRSYFEQRIEELHKDFSVARKPMTQAEYIAVLKQQKHQLHQRVTSLRQKTGKLAEDVNVLLKLNESLDGNKRTLSHQIDEANRSLAVMEVTRMEVIPPLERKVEQLMEQLDC